VTWALSASLVPKAPRPPPDSEVRRNINDVRHYEGRTYGSVREGAQ